MQSASRDWTGAPPAARSRPRAQTPRRTFCASRHHVRCHFRRALLRGRGRGAVTFAGRDELPVLGPREADAALVSFFWLAAVAAVWLRVVGRGGAPGAYRLTRLVPLTPFVAGQLLAHLLDPLANGLWRSRRAGPLLGSRLQRNPWAPVLDRRRPSGMLRPTSSQFRYRYGRVDGVLLAFRVACRSSTLLCKKASPWLPLCARSKSNLDNWPPRVPSFQAYSREFPVGTVSSRRHGFTPAPAATGKLCLAWTRAVSQDDRYSRLSKGALLRRPWLD